MDFSLKLKLNSISHSFGNKYFLFKDLNFEMQQSDALAICGPNGSGKSTLLKIIASLLKPSKGSVELSINSKKIERENFYKHISLIAPYLNLYEEFSALEHIRICNEFLAKADRHSEQSEEYRKGDFFSQSNFFMEKKQELLDLFEIKKIANEPIKTYSSGQKQRLKYILALLKDSSIFLLDEPFTNLDENGINIAKEMISKLINNNRIVIIASNDSREIELSKKIIELA